jgi:acetylornithine deacetylase
MSGAALHRRLAELVSFDTQNPTGDERALVDKLARDLRDLGATSVDSFGSSGHHAVYARFGEAPRLLLNAHLDTVPANSGYTSPPLAMAERDGRLHGLGTADTKGAIAAILEAVATRTAQGRPLRGVALLFSGDEEHGNACIKEFLASGRHRGLERAIVCEPTGLRVGHRHRGIGSAEAVALSPGGHSSRADTVPNPVLVLARAALALDAFSARHKGEGPQGFQGLCVNVAAIDGGVAFNVIPSRATLRVSLRPAPGADVRALLAEAEGEARRAAAPADVDWRVVHASPPFATRDLAAFAPLLGDAVAAPLDLAFWTEAALLSAAGVDAVVYGPGHIEQAHAPDEFVEVAQLEAAYQTFLRVLPT